MLSDNVLISSFIFFITCGVVWLIISRIENQIFHQESKEFYHTVVLLLFLS